MMSTCDQNYRQLMREKLIPYVEAAQLWWCGISSYCFKDTGIYEMPDAPPGLCIRFTRTPVRSPIKGIQAFPFLPTSYLQLRGIKGGAVKMFSRICLNDKFVIGGFTIVCKHNLPSIAQQGQFIAFIPTAVLMQARTIGTWLYFKQEEIMHLARGEVTQAMTLKAKRKVL